MALRWLATPATFLVEDLMLSLHPQARTTPAVRQEIARSSEPTGVLAQRFSVSTETVRKWHKRGAQQSDDFSLRGEVKALALQVAFERKKRLKALPLPIRQLVTCHVV